jgi:hypothetical protein
MPGHALNKRFGILLCARLDGIDHPEVFELLLPRMAVEVETE